MREVDVRVLQAGYCKHPQIMSIRDGTLRPVIFPSLSILLTHPVEGPIIFDTGYDPLFYKATRPFPERLYSWMTPVTLGSGEDVSSQLTKIGINPLDVRHVVLSHFHADHMAGTHAFQNAAIHCARAGLEAACSGGRFKTVRQGILKALIPTDIDSRARFFEDANEMALPDDFLPFISGRDILGDGSVLAVELPGHCPGHWGLALRQGSGQYHFLVADAAWSTDAIRRNVPPPAIASGFLGTTRKVKTTLGRLHDLWARNPDMRLTPTHCPECAEQAE